MPKELSVSELLMGLEPLCLISALDSKNIGNLIASSRLKDVSLDELKLRVLFRQAQHSDI